MPYSELSTDPKIREFKKQISKTTGTIKRTSDPKLKEQLEDQLAKEKAALARYVQNKK